MLEAGEMVAMMGWGGVGMMVLLYSEYDTEKLKREYEKMWLRMGKKVKLDAEIIRGKQERAKWWAAAMFGMLGLYLLAVFLAR